MAETKTSISELTAATTVGADDLIFVSQLSGSSYVSKKATVGQLLGMRNEGASGTSTTGDALTTVPSTYKTYADTVFSLSSDGYATQEQLQNALSSALSGLEGILHEINTGS